MSRLLQVGRLVQKRYLFKLCSRICKDNTKKFCPSCGNPTLLRASVTVAAPGASSNAQAVQVHLKPNFQYKLRGTRYPIPSPKPGSSKTGAGTGLILREDQVEYSRPTSGRRFVGTRCLYGNSSILSLIASKIVDSRSYGQSTASCNLMEEQGR